MTFSPPLRIPHISEWRLFPGPITFFPSQLLDSSSYCPVEGERLATVLCQDFNAPQGFSLGDGSCLLSVHPPFLSYLNPNSLWGGSILHSYTNSPPQIPLQRRVTFWFCSGQWLLRSFWENDCFPDKKGKILPRDAALYSPCFLLLFFWLEYRLEAWR